MPGLSRTSAKPCPTRKTIIMKFAEFVCRDAVTTGMSSSDRDGVIGELVDALVAAGAVSNDHRNSVLAATIAREELGTTGIGHGVAIPHAKHPAVKQVVATVGVSDHGIDFGSLDSRPTRVFFLLISPPDAPQDHLQALETISKHLQEELFREFLIQAQTCNAIHDVLDEADQANPA